MYYIEQNLPDSKILKDWKGLPGKHGASKNWFDKNLVRTAWLWFMLPEAAEYMRQLQWPFPVFKFHKMKRQC